MSTVTVTFDFVENPLVTDWENCLATANFQSTATGAKRTSNTATNGATRYRTTTKTFGNDQRSTITFGTLVADDRMGVVARADTTGGGKFYSAYYHDGNSQVIIQYWTAGAVSSTLETIGSTTFVNGDTLGLDVTGTSLRAYKNSVAIGTGATDSNIASGQPGMFYLDNNNNTGLISVWVGFDGNAPTINTQPTDQTVYEGQTATFSVSATSSGGTLSYQWYFDGSPVGTDQDSYARTNCVLADNNKDVYCEVTDDNGTTTSVTVNLFVLPAAPIFYLTA